MAKHGIAARVRELVIPILEAQQFELVDVEFKREGHTHYLRIFIDTPEGVTIDDCQRVSRETDLLLDVEDLIRTPYILEVSSPGLDRPLKTAADFDRFQGRLVKIKTFQSIQGQKKFLGHLKGITEEAADAGRIVTLTLLDEKDVEIPYEGIASARLEVEF